MEETATALTGWAVPTWVSPMVAACEVAEIKISSLSSFELFPFKELRTGYNLHGLLVHSYPYHLGVWYWW